MHNKQFIISKEPIKEKSFKNVNLANGYLLSYHEELNITMFNETLLIGNAFQGDEDRDIPEKEIMSLTSPSETYSTWNGRWVLLYKDEIHPDACAQLGIFYGEIGGDLIVSSSLALIAKLYKEKVNYNDYMPLEYDLLLSWVPGPYTVIDGIKRLLPSQFLKINHGFEVHFRNPISRTDYSSFSVEEIYKKIFKLQSCAFHYIEKYDFKEHKYSDDIKNLFNIGLTAGYDSRMQAALMRKMGLKIKSHTFERQKSTEYADVKYPLIIAQALGIDWDFIPIGKRQAKRVIEYNAHTLNSVKDRDWKWHYPCGQYDKVDGDVVISNSIWEAFCDYYVRFGVSSSIYDDKERKYEDLERTFETLEGNPIAEKSFKEYIDWVESNSIDGLSWADRITFEQLMGIWDGNENQGKDLFSHDTFMFNPANSMEIFALILALPKEKRVDRLWEEEIANMYAPDLKGIPYNEQSKDAVMNYRFPFDKEIAEKSIVLYGAGLVGRSFYIQMMTNRICDIIAWVDNDYKRLRENGIKVDSVDSIMDLHYDYLMVAVESKDLYETICDELVNKGIEKEKILWKETGTVFKTTPRKLEARMCSNAIISN